MIKLTETGIENVLYGFEDCGSNYYAYSDSLIKDLEFHPSHFKGAVVLTTNEAKQIISSLRRAIKAYVELSKLTNGWTEVSNEENSINMLKERIGRAEERDE